MKLTKVSLLTIVLVVLASVFALLPLTDSRGEQHIDASFKRALLGYAVARGLNGVISVAQGTEVAIQPAGVGINFTPGQILDPINDLVERFSWIMLLATSSLGVQKVLLSMSSWHGLIIGVAVAAILFVGSLLFTRSKHSQFILGRVFLFLLLLRFMMPAIAIANDWVYQTFLQSDYTQATEELQSAQKAIGQLNQKAQVSQAPSTGLVNRAKDIYQQMVQKIDLEKRYEEYRIAAESISENTIKLIVVFVMQTLVFPLLFLFVVFGLIRRLTRWSSYKN